MNEKANRLLATAMGVHWHEFKDADGEPDYLCKRCGELQNGRHTKPNPAYDENLEDAFALVEFMRREKEMLFSLHTGYVAAFQEITGEEKHYPAVDVNPAKAIATAAFAALGLEDTDGI